MNKSFGGILALAFLMIVRPTDERGLEPELMRLNAELWMIGLVSTGVFVRSCSQRRM